MMFRPIVFNEEVCNGCNRCADLCPVDVLAPNPVKGKPPIVAYPDECAYDGSCWIHCPLSAKGAIKVITPLPMRVAIKRGKRN